MNLETAWWIFGAGFVLLALGGEGVIRGGVVLKRALGISPVIIGLFVLSLGTSSPTLAIAMQGAASRIPDLAVGAVIGATLINLLLILGLCALISQCRAPPKVVLRDGGALLIASGVLVLLALHGMIGRREGVLLIGGFILYAVVAAVSDWRRSADHSVACAEAEKRMTGEHPSIGGGLFVLIVGGICLLIGAHFLVGGTLSLAAQWNLPLPVLAITLVAFAASVPVLLVTAVAAARGHTEVAIGHLITASVFNLLGVLGIAALVHPLRVSPVFAASDVFVVLGAAALLLPLLSANWRLSRPKAALLLLAYVGYVGYLAWRQGLLPHALPGMA
ncbi:MAG: sodium:calcium antiporter [Rhizomicrobium sp.]